MRCESSEAVKTQVKMGVGLGMLYQDLIESDLKSGDFQVIRVPKLDFDSKSCIVYRKDRALSPNTQKFLSLLRHWRL
jgi:DNA-binding transcriptional LysR family regulator